MRRPAKKLLHVVTVDFFVKPEFISEFISLISENAKTSVTLEKECFRFDVLTPTQTGKSHVFLYEIYASQEAFEHHLNTEHYKEFDKSSAHMVVSKLPKSFVLEEHVKVDR